MPQNKLTPSAESTQLIYFQNLVPGTQESPFIDRYKQECLPGEGNSERKQLLNEFPPVLSFFEKQKKHFYDEEAKNCTQFCCGAMGITQDLPGNESFRQQDHYMVSVGSGKLYEGSASNIRSEMQEDIKSSTFGSPEQQKSIDGFKQFEQAVGQREQNESQVNAAEEHSTLQNESTKNPFQTTPKPIKE